MDKLIYDRTNEDVEYARNNPSSAAFLKGTYNYTDLNRIEEWCQYIAEQLPSKGYSVSITTKTNWTADDFPTKAQLERIRSNVDALKNVYYANTDVPINMDRMDYKKANEIEKILDELYNNLLGGVNWYVYGGVARGGQPRIWQHRFREFYEPIEITSALTTETGEILTTEAGEELEVTIT